MSAPPSTALMKSRNGQVPGLASSKGTDIAAAARRSRTWWGRSQQCHFHVVDLVTGHTSVRRRDQDRRRRAQPAGVRGTVVLPRVNPRHRAPEAGSGEDGLSYRTSTSSWVIFTGWSASSRGTLRDALGHRNANAAAGCPLLRQVTLPVRPLHIQPRAHDGEGSRRA